MVTDFLGRGRGRVYVMVHTHSSDSRLTVSLKKRLPSAYNLEKRDPIQWGYNTCKEGIWLHETGILGASPDGYVQGTFKDSLNVYHQQAQCRISPDIVEIKCPFSAKDMTVAAACTTIKDFYIVTDEDGSLTLKKKENCQDIER